MPNLSRLWKKPKAPLDQLQSPLFALPAELRHQIFSLVLIYPFIALRGDPYPVSKHLRISHYGVAESVAADLRANRPLSLLLTCRRACEELLPRLYGENTFWLRDPEALTLLASPSGGPRAGLVRWLQLDWRLRNPPGKKQWKRWHGLERNSRLWCASYVHHVERGWAMTWAAVKRLTGLRWMRFELYAEPFTHDYWILGEREMFQNLQGALPLGAAGELSLPWRSDAMPRPHVEDLLEGWTVERCHDPYWQTIMDSKVEQALKSAKT